MLEHFRLWPFILGVIIGLVGIYWVKPQEATIFKYPTPDSAGKLVYKDKNGVCYKYETKKVDCDANAGRLKTFPLS